MLDLMIDAGMDKCKALLLENGEIFLTKASQARSKIARIACPWIPNGAVVVLNKFFNFNV
jgi:hypothetical protein